MARTKKTTSPTTLYGDLVTPENMAALAGVGVDDFPINLPFHNRTSSAMAFPELGIDLPAYAENVDVLILEKGGVSLFCMNYGYLSKLFGWNDKVGVFIGAIPTDSSDSTSGEVDSSNGDSSSSNPDSGSGVMISEDGRRYTIDVEGNIIYLD